MDRILDDNAGVLREDVRAFLRQYAFTLRRNIVQEGTELQRVAREIYLKHREAIELIYRHKPDYRNEIKQILKEAIEQQQSTLRLDKEDTYYIRFRPHVWTTLTGMESGNGWEPSARCCCSNSVAQTTI